MDFEKLYSDMLMNKPTTKECSLPVVVEKDDDKKIAWCHFSFMEEEQDVKAVITDIYMMDEDQRGVYINVDIVNKIEINQQPIEDPAISNREYLRRMPEMMLKSAGRRAMRELLGLIVPKPIMILYDVLMDFCSNLNWSALFNLNQN